MKCYACGKLGHISRDCTAPNGGPLNTAGKTCYQCGEAGHSTSSVLLLLFDSANVSLVSRDCPQKATNGELNADTVDLGVAPVPSVAPVA